MRIAIVNRGEVALRIIRACEELGFQTILLHSTADRETCAYRMADEVFELEGNTSTDTYLDIEKVVQGCKQLKADYVHPGFGFLSENPAFASRLAKEKIGFVGPSPEAMEKLGNKIAAKKLAKNLGISTLTSFSGRSNDLDALQREAKKIGFPIMIKAAAGGGGKGMKVAHDEKTFVALAESATREAKSSFGDETIFIEKFIEKPRHVEVQIFGDKKGNVIHLFERDCSVQRRFQKIIEESPALNLPCHDDIHQAAIKIAETANYENAGTIEFLVDQNNDFYFLEANTRLQVEHPVTEMITGIDLVKLQLEVATTGRLPLKQDEVRANGHSIETRIYAEDPANQFLPSTGKLGLVELPYGPHRRFDFGYASGDAVTEYYDPMIGKIITWGQNRDESIGRMIATLNKTIVFGVETNIEFLAHVLASKPFQKADLHTGLLSSIFPNGFVLPPLSDNEEKLIAGVQNKTNQNHGMNYQSPWVGA